MVLHTMEHAELEQAEFILKQKGMCYHVAKVNCRKVNIFFGNPDCVKVIQSFGPMSLSDYSPEQDFILGIMLGYDSKQQCKRYLGRKTREQEKTHLLPCRPVEVA